MGNSILCPPSNSAQAQKVGGYVLKVKQGDAKAQEELNTMIIKACKLYYGPRTTYKYWVPNIEPVYRCSFPMQDSTRSQLLLKKPSRISETLRFPTSLHLKQGYSPTRSQLIQEAYLAFSDPATEHLTNVRRVRSDITGETFVIAGKIVKTPIVNNKNFLRKCLDFVKKIRK